LVGVCLDYDSVVLTVKDSGSVRRIRADGYIGFEYSGVWDEMVIERAEVLTNDEFVTRTLESIRDRYSGPPPSTGSPTRNTAIEWQTLVVTFADGSILRCACANLVEE
jgi:hypothetical protein